jgi:ABC-type multidrug transport system, permease component
MSAFLNMTKINCKMLLRNIGFLVCLVLLPIGASALHMIQTSSGYVTDDQLSEIIELDSFDNAVLMDAKNVSVVFVDAGQDEFSDILLHSLTKEKWCTVVRYKSVPISVAQLKELVQDTYDRSMMAGVVYLPEDFSAKLMAGQSPELIILNGGKDGRFELLKGKINANLTVLAGCASSCESPSQAVSMAKETFEKMPSVKSIVTGDETGLSPEQTDHLRSTGYALAVLSLAFALTGCFVANLVVTESDNKALLRIEMSGMTMLKYIASKALTAVIVTVLQTAVTAAATAAFVGTDVGIPFGSYLLLVGMMGLIYNLLSLIFGIFFKNTTFAVYASFGVWVFANLISAVYFDFVKLPDWWQKLSLLVPQKWVMITSEALMKGESSAYPNFFLVSAAFLLVLLTAGYIGAERVTESR